MEREVTSKRQEYVRFTLIFICVFSDFFGTYERQEALCSQK